jgi:hypothetical protein
VGGASASPDACVRACARAFAVCPSPAVVVRRKIRTHARHAVRLNFSGRRSCPFDVDVGVGVDAGEGIGYGFGRTRIPTCGGFVSKPEVKWRGAVWDKLAG